MGWVGLNHASYTFFQLKECPSPTQALQKFTTQPNPSIKKKKKKTTTTTTQGIVVTSLNFTFELQFFFKQG